MSVNRNFIMSDSQLLVKATVFLHLFEENKAQMVALFPQLADPFADEFQAAIDYAESMPFSNKITSEISVSVDQIGKKMADAREAIQKLYMYVRIGWATKVKLKAFGQDDYTAARNKYLNMIDLLILCNRMANETENNTVLLNVGYTQADIDGLATLSNEIKALHDEIEDLKSNRLEQTLTRITAMNNVYAFMQKLNKASKIAFPNNPAMIQVFQLTHTKKKKPKVLPETA